MNLLYHPFGVYSILLYVFYNNYIPPGLILLMLSALSTLLKFLAWQLYLYDIFINNFVLIPKGCNYYSNKTPS